MKGDEPTDSHQVSANVTQAGPIFLSAIPTKRNEHLPSLYFLDSKAFSKNPSRALDPGLAVPDDLLSVLGNTDNLLGLCQTFFSTIHTWAAFLSQKRTLYKVSQFNPGTDWSFALLLISMKLACSWPEQEEDPRSSLYWLTKQSLAQIENSCLISLYLLQSAVLIATYEIGHGIFPAAYLSVGHAARLGHMMGLHEKKGRRGCLSFLIPGLSERRNDELGG